MIQHLLLLVVARRSGGRSEPSEPARRLAGLQPRAGRLHLPGPYDLTLRSSSVHVVEHAVFLAAGNSLLVSRRSAHPARTVLPIAQRIGYVATASVVNIALSMYLAFAQHALYGAYASLAHRPGGPEMVRGARGRDRSPSQRIEAWRRR